jgi:hypothetical protein
MLFRLMRSFPLNRARFWGMARVFAYVLVLNVLLAVLCVRWAWADAEKAVETAGLALLRQLGPMPTTGVQPIVVNGQRLFFASHQTSLGVPEVLNVFDRHCQENSSKLGEELGKLPARMGAVEFPERLRDPARWAIVREEARDGDAGQLGCLAQPREGGLSAVVKRVQAFVESGDLSKLGDARFVAARRAEDGKSTQVLALWTDGPFRFTDMFLSEGDAPGSDPQHVPRPPDAKRVFSAEVPDQPYALRMYDSTKARPALLGFYDGEMKKRGWTARPVAPKPGSDDFVIDHPESRAFTKNGSALLLTTDALDGGKTGVTLIEMGGSGAAQAVAKTGWGFDGLVP